MIFRIITLICCLSFSLMTSAQASGGQIRRKTNASSSAKPSRGNSVNRTSSRQFTTEQKSIANNIVSNMVYVEGGSFIMGAPEGSSFEKPAHQVSLSSFYIAKYEVTQKEWRTVMGYIPKDLAYQGDDLPIFRVSWYECQKFIKKLNSMTGKQFRLPTEAEWEYAAKGGNRSHGYIYSGSDNATDVAWFSENSGGTLQPVGLLKPNELGIYDMSGNMFEWCNDWYGPYSSNSQVNPTGPDTGQAKVIRGGDYALLGTLLGGSHAQTIKKRGQNYPDMGGGFRLALPL